MTSAKRLGMESAAGYDLLERKWLKSRFKSELESDASVIVIAAEPGMGKTTFLRGLAREYAGSCYVDIRRPLGTDKAEGFWSALLSQVDLEGTRIPALPYHAARLAAEQLPMLDIPHRRLVIVDSLERAPELLDGAGFAGLDADIPGITLVIGSRPGHHVDILQANGARLIYIDPEAPANRAEMQGWAVEKLGAEQEEVAQALIENSEGNFLVASHLLRALQDGSLASHDLDQTPASLKAALAVLWEEQYESAQYDIHDDLVRVACLIADAGEPLPPSSIADFLGYSASRVGRALYYLRPLLHATANGLAFFSTRLARLIADCFRRDLVKVHEQVISYFRDSFPSWEEMDDRYGWFYLCYHCDRLARTSRRRDYSTLHWLGEGPYIKAKLNHTHSLSAVLQDLNRCLKASLEERDLPRIVSYGLRIPLLRDKEVMNGLHDLADLGMYSLATERAMLLSKESTRLKALILLAWQAAEEGCQEVAKSLITQAGNVVLPDFLEEDRLLYAFILADLLTIIPAEEIFKLLLNCADPRRSASIAWRISMMDKLPHKLRLRVLNTAMQCARKIAVPQERELYLKRLAHDVTALKSLRVLEGGYSIDNTFIREVNSVEFTYEGSEAYNAVLKEVAQAEDKAAVMRQALEKTGSFTEEADRVGALSAFTQELVKYSEAEWSATAFEELIAAIVSLHCPSERQRAVVAVTRLVTGVARSGGWREVFERLGAIIETLEDPCLRVRAWVWLALARHEARDFKGAHDTLTASAALAFHIANQNEQARALALLASCAASVDNNAHARDLAFHSLQALEAPPMGRVDTETRAAMVVGVSANVTEERSLEYLDSSIKAAREIPDMRVRANLLAALAGGLYKLGEEEWARRTQDQALEVARSIEAGGAQAKTLAQLAIQESQCGNVPRADLVLAEAEKAVESEKVPAMRREALLFVANARRQCGDETGARNLIMQVIAELEKLNYSDLVAASDLSTLAASIKEPKSKETLIHLLKKMRKALKNTDTLAREKGLLLLSQSWLIIGDEKQALEDLQKIEDEALRICGRVSLAKSLICSNAEKALAIIQHIPVFSERMRAVRECTTELLHDSARAKRRETQDVLAQLTLLGVEDEYTADILVARWVNLASDRRQIVEALGKIGYSLEDLTVGRVSDAPDL